MNKSYLFLITILLFFTTCIEPYDPEINEYKNILVVEGLFTNNTGPHTVKLSRTSSINIPVFISEDAAEVYIYDELGNSELLNQTAAGTYESSGTGLQGVVGRQYKLYVKTRNGNEYESEFMELPEPIEIDSLYSVVDAQVSDESSELNEGYQFVLETSNNTEKDVNFLWEAIETYEYNADYELIQVYDTAELQFVDYPRPKEFYKCYMTNKIDEVYLMKVKDDKVNLSLNFASAKSKKLLIKYSLLVNQYTINDRSYKYWNDLQKIMAQGSSLYNSQPFQVESNMKNINDDNEPVVGFFTVAGASKRRIFADAMIPDDDIKECTPSPEVYQSVVENGRSTITLYATYGHGGELGVVSGSCIFCTQQGGVQEKPDFWDDNI